MDNNCGCNEGEKECTCGEDENSCGCEENHEEEQIIYLTLEDGNQVECTVIGSFEVEDNDYMALLTEDEDVYLYRYEEVDEDELDLINIEDDDEFQLVSDVFYDLFLEE